MAHIAWYSENMELMLKDKKKKHFNFILRPNLSKKNFF